MNKRGFTLIELLAVIVILAIIALIATPIVLNIIKDSKSNAQLRSAEMYIKGLETSIATSTLNNKKVPDKEYSILPDGNICLVEPTNNTCSDNDTLEVEMNGEKPKSGTVTVLNGKITDIELTYTNGKTIGKDTKGDLVYLKKFKDICKYANNGVEEKKAGAKYTCEVKEGTSYNFYVLKTPAEGEKTINLIMDRNICEDGTLATAEKTCSIEWLSKDDYINNDGPNTEQFTDGGPCQYGFMCTMNELGPITAMTYLNKATSTWENIDNLNLTYDDEGTNFTDFELNGKARLPYKSEVSAYDSTNKTNAYLYDYLKQSGTIQTNAISGINGYWTLSSYADDSGAAWFVNHGGNVVSNNVVNSGIGVRAVITLKI